MYDLIIIGAGPAGLTASIYASCYHLKHLVIGEVAGGQLQFAPDILNYPGFDNISGKELTERIVGQVKLRGGEVVIGSVVKITPLVNKTSNVSNPVTSENNPITQYANNPINNEMNQLSNESIEQSNNKNYFEIETKEGNKYQTRVIILATGTERRKLNIPGEVEYTGKGVHYCATCEKQDYADKVCAVVGGANSAVQAAVELSQTAAKVYIVYRGEQLRGDPIWLEQVEKNQKIEVIYNAVVTEIVGDGSKITGIKLKLTTADPTTKSGFAEVGKNFSAHLPNSPHPLRGIGSNTVGVLEKLASPQNLSTSSLASPAMSTLPLDKIFIEIGGVPGTALVIPLGVEMDTGGYIKVNARLATNVPGIFAAGDLVSYGLSIEQISSAVGLGARAAASAFAFIKQEKPPTVWGASQIKRTAT